MLFCCCLCLSLPVLLLLNHLIYLTLESYCFKTGRCSREKCFLLRLMPNVLHKSVCSIGVLEKANYYYLSFKLGYEILEHPRQGSRQCKKKLFSGSLTKQIIWWPNLVHKFGAIRWQVCVYNSFCVFGLNVWILLMILIA